MKSHILQESSEKLANVEAIRQNYENALKVVELRKCATLWICAADFEIRQEAFTKARTLL